MSNEIIKGWPYQVGEIISVKIDAGHRMAKIIARHSRTPEGWGGDEGDVDGTTIQFLDTQETMDVATDSLTWRSDMPLDTMLELSERLSIFNYSDALSDEESSHINSTITSLWRLISESALRNLELLGLPNDTRFVLIDEEYDFRYHLWFPEMNVPEVIKWWQELVSTEVDTMNPTSIMPGKVFTMDTTKQRAIWRALRDNANLPFVHLFNDGDSFLRVDGQIHHHNGFDPHYYDPKPCDTTIETDGKGNIIRQSVPEEHPCQGCAQHGQCKRDNKE